MRLYYKKGQVRSAGDPSSSRALTNQGAVLQHLAGWDSGGVHPDYSKQGKVIKQVQGPLREPRQEIGLKTNLHQRSKVHQGSRTG